MLLQSATKATVDNNTIHSGGECVYQVPTPKSNNLARKNPTTPKTKRATKLEESLYECAPKNTPVSGSEAKKELNKSQGDSGECAYQVPYPKPVKLPHANRTSPKTEKHTSEAEEPLYQCVPKNTPVRSVVASEAENVKLNELQIDRYHRGNGNGKESNESSNRHQRYQR